MLDEDQDTKSDVSADKKRTGSPALGALLIIAAGCCWGTSGTIQALAPKGATPLSVGSVRICFAALLLLALTFCRGRRKIFRRRWRPRGVLVAALGFTLYQYAFFSAVKLSGVAVGTMVAIGAAPAIAGLLGRLIYQERLTRRWLAATVLAVAGCTLLVAAGSGSIDAVSIPGAILALCAALAYTCVGAGLRLMRSRNPLDAISVVIITSGVLGSPYFLFGDISWLLTPRGAICALLLACVTTILPYSLFAWGVQLVTMGRAYTLALSEPLTACVFSICLLGEKLTVPGTLGVLLIFSGILLLARES